MNLDLLNTTDDLKLIDSKPPLDILADKERMKSVDSGEALVGTPYLLDGSKLMILPLSHSLTSSEHNDIMGKQNLLME